MAEAKSKQKAQTEEKVEFERVTEETPAEADKTSVPNAMDAEHEQPPVRTSSPDVPISQTLGAGAGEHTPPDPDVYDREGRKIDEEEGK